MVSATDSGLLSLDDCELRWRLLVKLSLQLLAYGQSLVALFGYVVPKQVNLVEQLAGSRLKGIRLAKALVGKGVYDNLYSLGLDFHLYILAFHYWVSVIMDKSGLIAVYV